MFVAGSLSVAGVGSASAETNEVSAVGGAPCRGRGRWDSASVNARKQAKAPLVCELPPEAMAATAPTAATQPKTAASTTPRRDIGAVYGVVDMAASGQAAFGQMRFDQMAGLVHGETPSCRCLLCPDTPVADVLKPHTSSGTHEIPADKVIFREQAASREGPYADAHTTPAR
jgi:hypothetical protein